MPRISSKKLAALRARGRTSFRGRRGKKVRQAGLISGRMIGRSLKDGLALSAARRLPNFAGKYQGAVDKLIAGLVMKLFKQGGSAMIEVGGAEAIANGIDDFIVPLVGRTIGGGLTQAGGVITQVTNPNVGNQK